MEVIVGKTAGFCGGVINSVTKSSKYLDENGAMYCLGEIVHNKQVVKSLEEKGMTTIDDIRDVDDNSKVIIRAHGVPKSVYEIAESKNIQVFDLTCPNVLNIHKQAEKLVSEGYYVLLVAQKDHPEAIGTISFCNDDSLIIEDISEVESVISYIKDKGYEQIAVISQTTYSESKFNDITELLKENFSDIKIFNTICNATHLRQKETEELSSSVDAMIIIGGKNSSNTKKLYDIASKNCKTYLIETIDDVDFELDGIDKIGVMAGASTPQESISEVINFLNKK